MKCIDYRGAPRDQGRSENEESAKKERTKKKERKKEGWGGEKGERDTGFYNGAGSYIGKRVNALTCFEFRKASEKGEGGERGTSNCTTTKECMSDQKSES